MSEKPILFNAEMVRAVLDGRKTQTRRILKDAPSDPKCTEHLKHPDGRWFFKGGGIAKCPYGKPGTKLWVRETWAHLNDYDGQVLLASSRIALYRADNEETIQPLKWKPSIHMPRWASRINLEITDIRVERVQDISDQEAKAEGVDGIPDPTILGTNYHHIIPFAELWDSINKKRGYGWDENPWVWCVSFKKI